MSFFEIANLALILIELGSNKLIKTSKLHLVISPAFSLKFVMLSDN